MPHERAPPGRPDALEAFEDRLARARAAPLPVEAEREAVGLVPQPLEQLEPRRVAVEPDGVGAVRQEISSSRLASEMTATRGRS